MRVSESQVVKRIEKIKKLEEHNDPRDNVKLDRLYRSLALDMSDPRDKQLIQMYPNYGTHDNETRMEYLHDQQDVVNQIMDRLGDLPTRTRSLSPSLRFSRSGSTTSVGRIPKRTLRRTHSMNGGTVKNSQAGGTYLPAEYHGHNSGSYVATPAGLADGAYGKQRAVSQGIIGSDGTAGPNLAWAGGSMMTGGGKKKKSGSWKKSASMKKKGGCGGARW